jgi:hypothetical protein
MAIHEVVQKQLQMQNWNRANGGGDANYLCRGQSAEADAPTKAMTNPRQTLLALFSGVELLGHYDAVVESGNHDEGRDAIANDIARGQQEM